MTSSPPQGRAAGSDRRAEPPRTQGAPRTAGWVPGWLAGFSPVHLLLLVAVAELSVTRLAIPVLAPRPVDPARIHGPLPEVPLYYEVLDNVGLFLRYFGTTLAVAVLVLEAVTRVRRRPRGPAALGPIVLATLLAGVAAAAVVNAVIYPGPTTSFVLQTAWAAAITGVVVGAIVRRHDLGVTAGLVVLAVPLLVHYHAVFSAQVLVSEDELLDGPLLDRAERWGLHALVVAALLTPYCFSPRPVVRALLNVAPIGVALLVGGIAAVLVRREYGAALKLAGLGTGIDLSPGVPSDDMALYLLALSTLAWTLTACTLAESEARRQVGMGLGLVVLGGYGFVWPLHFLLGVAGLVVIAGAAPRLRDEEHGAIRPRTPPIEDAVWQGWVAQLVTALRRGAGDDASSVNAVTVRGEHDTATTVIVADLGGVPTKLRLQRYAGALVSIDLVCGRELPESARPVWTLYALPESARDAHPEPAPAGPVVKVDDLAFAARFRARGDGAALRDALDEPLRARCAAVLDGWLACWPGTSVRYRVYPGVGAPMDHPVPVSDLALRHDGAIDRTLAVLDVVGAVARRALAAAPSADEPPPRVLDPATARPSPGPGRGGDQAFTGRARPARARAIDPGWVAATMRACQPGFAASSPPPSSPSSPAAVRRRALPRQRPR